MLRRLTASLLSLALLLSLSGGASLAAPGRTGTVIAEQKSAGTYRLVLQVGPAQKMVIRGKKGSGEMMIGGQMAACQMVKSANSLATAAGACNHHVELHVYRKSNGKIVKGAVVAITMINSQTSATIRVPIMEMERSGLGSKDYHYGNNVYAASGHYKVDVQVNSVATTFAVDLS